MVGGHQRKGVNSKNLSAARLFIPVKGTNTEAVDLATDNLIFIVASQCKPANINSRWFSNMAIMT
jgi:hypothetical protein